MRDVYRNNSGGSSAGNNSNRELAGSPSMDTVGSAQPPRRRRTTTNAAIAGDNSDRQQLRHSPQHYLDEYNKNSKPTVIHNSSHLSNSLNRSYNAAPHSTGGLGFSRSQTASDIYYAQYYNHDLQQQQQRQQQQQHYDGNNSMQQPPGLHRTNSFPNAHKASFQHFENSFHLNPDPLAAVHFRRALHVADKDYQDFLHGQGGRNTAPVLHPVCCANVCAGFSFVGVLFMIFIGILMDTQPLFIGGALPSTIKENDNGKATTIYFIPNERLPLASHAYQAGFAYLVSMIGCLVFVYYERMNSMMKRRSYQDVPDAMSPPGTPGSNTGVVGGDEGGLLPDYRHNNTHRHGEAGAYELSPWSRVAGATSKSTVKLREWASRVYNGRASANNNRKARKKNAKTI